MPRGDCISRTGLIKTRPAYGLRKPYSANRVEYVGEVAFVRMRALSLQLLPAGSMRLGIGRVSEGQMPNKQAKSGGARKIGRNKPKCARYRSRDTRYRNKYARVLKSNGAKAADAYRLAHVRGVRVAV